MRQTHYIQSIVNEICITRSKTLKPANLIVFCVFWASVITNRLFQTMSQKQEFELEFVRFFKQTFFIFLFIIGHLLVIYFTVPLLDDKFTYFDFVFYFIFLIGILTFPSVYMLMNYLKYSVHKKITITTEGITLINKKTGEKNFVQKKRFKKVHYFSNDGFLNRLPWVFHEHVIIEIEGREPVVITSYIADISSLSVDALINGYFRGADSARTKSMFEPINVSRL